MLVEFPDDFPGFKPSAVCPELFDQAGSDIEQRDVLDDDGGNAGPQHLDSHFAPVRQHGEVHLCHRGAGDRHRVKFRKDLADRPVVGTIQRLVYLLHRKWWHLVLQFRQFVRDVERNQVAARRQNLAELDENGSEGFQSEAQPLAARAIEAAPEQSRR